MNDSPPKHVLIRKRQSPHFLNVRTPITLNAIKERLDMLKHIESKLTVPPCGDQGAYENTTTFISLDAAFNALYLELIVEVEKFLTDLKDYR